MIAKIEFVRPKSIKETLQLLAEPKKKNCILAGGTDVITGIQMQSKRFSTMDRLIDTNGISQLKHIKVLADQVSIGAAVTFSELQRNKPAQKHLPLLVKAAQTLGNLQIRNRATIAGNFINNAPCADSVPPLLVYNTKLRIESLNTKKEVYLKDFLIKAYTTILNPDELVTEICIPVESEYSGDFYKLGRRQSVAISRISLAVLAKIENNSFSELRLASGAVSPIGQRFPEIEAFAQGKVISSELLKEIANKMAKQVLDLTGLRWSSLHKIPVLQQMLYQMMTREFKRYYMTKSDHEKY